MPAPDHLLEIRPQALTERGDVADQLRAVLVDLPDGAEINPPDADPLLGDVHVAAHEMAQVVLKLPADMRGEDVLDHFRIRRPRMAAISMAYLEGKWPEHGHPR